MNGLIKEFILKHMGNNPSGAEVGLEALDDAAVIDDIVLKSDSHAVRPIFFPGGDIGRLSISGTVNDISCLGAEPIALACGFVLEEGLALTDFERILVSMRKACDEAGAYVITGDTKVVEKGSLGGCVVNVSGIGRRTEALEHNFAEVRQSRPSFKGRWLLDSNVRPSEKIILSGTIGDHGLAVLSAQEGLSFGSSIVSDVRPLNKLVQQLLQVGGIVALKDPTRGGLANALNEWSEKSQVGILVYEDRIPIRQNVKAACEMLGIDPLEVGNEGKLIIGVVKEKADELLAKLRSTKEGKEAQIIGQATKRFSQVAMQTSVGGKRIIPTPIGDPIPRIC
jgi:hydrogenase expression/formation protein HypE